MNAFKIQSLKELRKEMVAVARGEMKAPANAHVLSFESVEAMARLLTRENRELLAAIETEKPESVAALALSLHRAESNVSRTLSKLVNAGFVNMRAGKGKTKIPEVKIRHVIIEINTLQWSDQISIA